MKSLTFADHRITHLFRFVIERDRNDCRIDSAGSERKKCLRRAAYVYEIVVPWVFQSVRLEHAPEHKGGARREAGRAYVGAAQVFKGPELFSTHNVMRKPVDNAADRSEIRALFDCRDHRVDAAAGEIDRSAHQCHRRFIGAIDEHELDVESLFIEKTQLARHPERAVAEGFRRGTNGNLWFILAQAGARGQ